VLLLAISEQQRALLHACTGRRAHALHRKAALEQGDRREEAKRHYSGDEQRSAAGRPQRHSRSKLLRRLREVSWAEPGRSLQYFSAGRDTHHDARLLFSCDVMNDALPKEMPSTHAECWGKMAAAPPTAAVHRTMGIAQKTTPKKAGKCLCEVTRGASRRQREDKRSSAADTPTSAGTPAAQRPK
jgi:hypothetical protein